jgi:hypothetical protein
MQMHWNRRSGFDRRHFDSHIGEQEDSERRHYERRRPGTDGYMLVMGDSGVDRFGMMVLIPVALLVVAAAIGVAIAR